MVSGFLLQKLRADITACVTVGRVDLLYLFSTLVEHTAPPDQRQCNGIRIVLESQFSTRKLSVPSISNLW